MTRVLLTGYLQRRVPADCLTQVVPGYTHVHSFVRFAPSSMHDAQKEKRAAGQQHAVGARVFSVRFDSLPILVPLDDRSRPSFRFAIQCRWLPFGHNEVRRVLYDPWRKVFKTRARACNTKGEMRKGYRRYIGSHKQVKMASEEKL